MTADDWLTSTGWARDKLTFAEVAEILDVDPERLSSADLWTAI